MVSFDGASPRCEDCRGDIKPWLMLPSHPQGHCIRFSLVVMVGREEPAEAHGGCGLKPGFQHCMSVKTFVPVSGLKLLGGMYRCTCSCVYEAGRSTSGVSLQCPPHHFLSPGHHLMPLRTRCTLANPLFLWVLGFRHRPSGLHDKHFTDWVTSSDLKVLNQLLLDSILEKFPALPMQ